MNRRLFSSLFLAALLLLWPTLSSAQEPLSAAQVGSTTSTTPPAKALEKAVSAERISASTQDASGNFAVIVGVNQFEDESVNPLSYAVADAMSIYRELTREGGLVPENQAYLHITDGENPPTYREIYKSIRFASQHTPENGMLILYFSSHGFLDSEKRSYVMPQDGDLSILERTAISLSEVLIDLKASASKKRALIVDACRNLPLKTSKGADNGSSEQFYEELKRAEGQVTLLACGPGEVSYEDADLGHGIFTYHVLEGLRGKAANVAGMVTISSLAEYTAGAVQSWCLETRKNRIQKPWLSGEMSGSIPLAYRNASVAPTPGSPVAAPSSETLGESEMGGRVFTGKRLPASALKGDEWEWPLPDGGSYTLCYVPARKFRMGSTRAEISAVPVWVDKTLNLTITEDAKQNLEWEFPQHTVEMPSYWIGKYEVTVGQFSAFVRARDYTTEAELGNGSYIWDASGDPVIQEGVNWREPGYEQEDNHPVVCLSWNDAQAFAKWAGLRLPTEAEWEKAARGLDGRTFPWGNEDPDGTQCNFADKNTSYNWSIESIDDGYEGSAPVGSYARGRSPYGCHDMAGNVWEWCEDWFDAEFYASLEDGAKSPICEDETSDRKVYRGGSWSYNPRFCRSASRSRYSPGNRDFDLGFRLAASLE